MQRPRHKNPISNIAAFPDSPLTKLTMDLANHQQKLNRSCEECRTRKCRCQLESIGPSNKCARCEKLQLRCTFIAPVTRRRRKRANARIDNLENELRQLKRKLDRSDTRSVSPTQSTSGTQHAVRNAHDTESDTDDLVSTRQTADSHLSSVVSGLAFRGSRKKARDNARVIDESVQQTLLQRFIDNMSPHMPFVDLPKERTLQQLHDKYPCTLLAILVASSAGFKPETAKLLARELDETCADLTIIQGQKSVDLVQALLITAIWYQPPDRFQELKFTQYTHIAVNMALDLRLGEIKSGVRTASKDLKNIRLFIMSHIMSSRYIIRTSPIKKPKNLHPLAWL